MQISKELRETIIDLLMPIMSNQGGRKAFVTNALYGDNDLLNHIGYEGAPYKFTTDLVDTCLEQEKPDAVVQLLQELSGQSGADKQRRITGAIEQLRRETTNLDDARSRLSGRADAGSAPPQQSGGTNISIGGNVSGGNVNIGGNQTIQGDQVVGGGTGTDPKASSGGQAAPEGWFARHQIAVVIATIIAALIGLFGVFYATNRPTDIRILPADNVPAVQATAPDQRITITPVPTSTP